MWVCMSRASTYPEREKQQTSMILLRIATVSPIESRLKHVRCGRRVCFEGEVGSFFSRWGTRAS